MQATQLAMTSKFSDQYELSNLFALPVGIAGCPDQRTFWRCDLHVQNLHIEKVPRILYSAAADRSSLPSPLSSFDNLSYKVSWSPTSCHTDIAMTPKLDDIWYTRPKAERSGSIDSENSSQYSGKSGSSNGIPDGLQLRLVLDGRTCPPCSVRDFNVRLLYSHL